MWGRQIKVGKIYTRNIASDNTVNNNRRKLLTSLGHPNVFSKGFGGGYGGGGGSKHG